MEKFFARCKNCKKETDASRSEEDPPKAIGVYVNFCPECEDEADDYLAVTSYIYPKNLHNKNQDQLKLF